MRRFGNHFDKDKPAYSLMPRQCSQDNSRDTRYFRTPSDPQQTSCDESRPCIISIFQAITDSACNGQNVLQCSSHLNPWMIQRSQNKDFQNNLLTCSIHPHERYEGICSRRTYNIFGSITPEGWCGQHTLDSGSNIFCL